MVRTGFQRAFGADLRQIVRAGTQNRFFAFFAGLGVTALVQSSTATALMTASFAARGLVTLAAALAVMLGADVGTTLVAQVLSLKLQGLAPIFILVGVVAFLSTSRTRQRDLGRVGIGLGLMLLALRLIFEASTPMREAEVMQILIQALGNEPIISIVLAALLTWLAHSSLAMVLLIMSLVAASVLPVASALWLVLGANLGGAVAPVIATARSGAHARRVTVGNLIMRAVGVAIAVPFCSQAVPYLAQFDPDPARQIVNFHTAFNIALALLFIWLIGPVARIVEKIFPEASGVLDPATPRYLERDDTDEPALALAGAAREALRMGDVVEAMLTKCGEVIRTDDRKLLKEVERMDDIVDSLHEQIKLFVTEVTRHQLDDDQSARCVEIMSFATNLEHIGDIIDKNLMELAAKKIKHKLAFSEQGLAEIDSLHEQVLEHLRLSYSIFLSGDLETARRLVTEKARFRELERAAADSHMQRLRSGRPESLETSSLHLDVLRDLKRIHSHIASVAYPILEAADELRASRLR